MRDPSEARGTFPETRLTLIRRVAFGVGAEREQAAEEFWQKYRGPLLMHLMFRFRLSRTAAEDTLHEFYHRKFAPAGKPCLLTRFQAREGSRFRNFLMKTLQRFEIDQLRKARTARCRPNSVSALVPDLPFAALSTDRPSPGELFDYAWAAQLLARAMDLMKERAARRGTPVLWDAFRIRFLDPALSGVRPASIRAIADRMNLGGGTSAFRTCEQANALFRECVFEILGEYTESRVSGEEELSSLVRSLSRCDFILGQEFAGQ